MRQFPKVLSLCALLFLARSASGEPDAKIAPDNPRLETRGGLPGLASALKAQKGLHVAFLGGSITENQSGHSAMVPAWLKATFPETEIKATNAGLSSTCSTTGAFRLERDVFGGDPVDLLVVEFAVNDDQDAAHPADECLRGMEGIVRHVRREHPACDLIMVQYVNPQMLEKLGRGETPTAIAAHEKVAAHYGVTSVNVAAEVADAVQDGRYTWKDYGGTHPGKFGYRVASNMIIAAIENGIQAAAETAPLPAAIDEQSYAAGKLVSVAGAECSDGWRLGTAGRELLPLGKIRPNYEAMALLRGDAPGDELSLEFEGSAVGAFVLAGPDAGRVEVSIDGGAPTTHELYHRYSGGLNYPRSVVFASGLAPGKHTLKLRIAGDMHPKSKGTTASILNFEVTP